MKAVTVERAIVLLSAVACFVGSRALVVVVDDLFSVIHTAVTDFDGVAVKYLAEVMILKEIFVN